MGGPELPPLVVFRAIEEISRADGAIGWCAMIATCASNSMGLLQADVGREMAGCPAPSRSGLPGCNYSLVSVYGMNSFWRNDPWQCTDQRVLAKHLKPICTSISPHAPLGLLNQLSHCGGRTPAVSDHISRVKLSFSPQVVPRRSNTWFHIFCRRYTAQQRRPPCLSSTSEY